MSESDKEDDESSESTNDLPKTPPTQELVSLEELIEEIPDEAKKVLLLERIQSITISQAIHHSGPLPSPSTLKEYGSIIENGAERITQMAENQTNHRMALETSTIGKQLGQSGRGQWFALIIALVALVIAWDLAKSDHDAVAGIIGGATVVGLVSAFIYGKVSQNKNLEDKDPLVQ